MATGLPIDALGVWSVLRASSVLVRLAVLPVVVSLAGYGLVSGGGLDCCKNMLNSCRGFRF